MTIKSSSPDAQERKRQRDREYRSRPEVKARRREYLARPDVQDRAREATNMRILAGLLQATYGDDDVAG